MNSATDPYFYVNQMYLSGSNAIYGCAESTSTTDGPLLLFKVNLNGARNVASS